MYFTSFRFELMIVWRIQIDEEGKVSPKLDLLTKVPQRGRALGVDVLSRGLLSMPGKALCCSSGLVYFVCWF